MSAAGTADVATLDRRLAELGNHLESAKADEAAAALKLALNEIDDAEYSSTAGRVDSVQAQIRAIDGARDEASRVATLAATEHQKAERCSALKVYEAAVAKEAKAILAIDRALLALGPQVEAIFAARQAMIDSINPHRNCLGKDLGQAQTNYSMLLEDIRSTNNLRLLFEGALVTAGLGRFGISSGDTAFLYKDRGPESVTKARSRALLNQVQRVTETDEEE